MKNQEKTFMRVPKALLKKLNKNKITKRESYAEVIERKLCENEKLVKKLERM